MEYDFVDPELFSERERIPISVSDGSGSYHVDNLFSAIPPPGILLTGSNPRAVHDQYIICSNKPFFCHLEISGIRL